MTCLTRISRAAVVLLAVAVLATAAGAAEGQDAAADGAAADSVPRESQYDWPTFRLIAPGDTLVVPDTASHGVFVLDRREREIEEIRRRRDSIRVMLLRSEVENLRAQRDNLRQAADTLRWALSRCQTAKAGAWEAIAAKNEAIEALRPGPLEALARGPLGDVIKIAGGAALGRLSCD